MSLHWWHRWEAIKRCFKGADGGSSSSSSTSTMVDDELGSIGAAETYR